MITRRGLLQGILAAGMAPAICKAEILMPVKKIIVPTLITGEIGEWSDFRFIESGTGKVTAGPIIWKDQVWHARDQTAFYIPRENDWVAQLKGHA